MTEWHWAVKLTLTLIVNAIVVHNLARVMWPDKFKRRARKDDVR